MSKGRFVTSREPEGASQVISPSTRAWAFTFPESLLLEAPWSLGARDSCDLTQGVGRMILQGRQQCLSLSRARFPVWPVGATNSVPTPKLHGSHFHLGGIREFTSKNTLYLLNLCPYRDHFYPETMKETPPYLLFLGALYLDVFQGILLLLISLGRRKAQTSFIQQVCKEPLGKGRTSDPF